KITVAGTPGTKTVTTTYAVNSTDGSLIPHEEPAVVVPSKPTVVKVPAKDEVEYLKEGDNIVKKTTTYEVNASTGALTPTVRKDIASPNGVKSKVVTKIIPITTRYEADKTKDVGTNTVTNNGSEGKIVTTTSTLVNETNGTVTDETPVVSRTEMVPKVVKVGAKSKVVETPIEPEVEYVRDGEREVDTPNERVEGAKGKTVTTTTYDVDSKDGHITEHVGNPVVTPAGKTI
ncbi:G5 domain protein, partial [Streptococcus mitis SK575]